MNRPLYSFTQTLGLVVPRGKVPSVPPYKISVQGSPAIQTDQPQETCINFSKAAVL